MSSPLGQAAVPASTSEIDGGCGADFEAHVHGVVFERAGLIVPNGPS
jgi:hypothetical protein